MYSRWQSLEVGSVSFIGQEGQSFMFSKKVSKCPLKVEFYISQLADDPSISQAIRALGRKPWPCPCVHVTEEAFYDDRELYSALLTQTPATAEQATEYHRWSLSGCEYPYNF